MRLFWASVGILTEVSARFSTGWRGKGRGGGGAGVPPEPAKPRGFDLPFISDYDRAHSERRDASRKVPFSDLPGPEGLGQPPGQRPEAISPDNAWRMMVK